MRPLPHCVGPPPAPLRCRSVLRVGPQPHFARLALRSASFGHDDQGMTTRVPRLSVPPRPIDEMAHVPEGRGSSVVPPPTTRSST